MIKILIVSTVRIRQNGITNVIFNFYKAIDKTDMQIDVLAFNEPEKNYIDEIQRCGGKLIVMPDRSKTPLGYVRKYMQTVKGYDIVHVNGNSSTMAFELFMARIAGVKVRIAHCHNVTCKYKKLDIILRPLFYHSYTEAFACSDLAGKWMFPNKEFKVLNNAFNVENFKYDSEVRKKYREAMGLGDKVVLGHIGLFNEQKNHNFLIHIFEEYRKKNSNAVLMLVGTGVLETEIRELVSKKGLSDSVRFLGTRADVNKVINVFDYFVFPSKCEGLGIVLMEAQANGMPVLASADVIPREVKVTENFIFMSLEEPAETWAGQLLKMTPDRDPQANKTVCEAGYSVEKEAGRLRSLYQSFMRK